MTDNEKLDRQSFIAQAPKRLAQKIEIFFARNASDIEQAHLSICRAELLEERRIASRGMKQLGVLSARMDF